MGPRSKRFFVICGWFIREGLLLDVLTSHPAVCGLHAGPLSCGVSQVACQGAAHGGTEASIAETTSEVRTVLTPTTNDTQP